jgi:hypothetical protein
MSDFPSSLERINWGRVMQMIQRRAPVKRVRSEPRRGPAGIPEDEWRNEAYRSWLTECRCVACIQALKLIGTDGRIFFARQLCDAAHGPVDGTSVKGADRECIPLCRAHHDEQHRLRWPKFEARYGFDRAEEAAAHWTRFKVLEASDVELD